MENILNSVRTTERESPTCGHARQMVFENGEKQPGCKLHEVKIVSIVRLHGLVSRKGNVFACMF